MSNFNFGEQVVLDNGFSPLPVGWYSTVITKMEFRPTKANNGEYLHTTFTVIGDSFRGRKIFHLYNLVNANPKAVEIAVQQMKSLLIETGQKESDLSSVSKEKLIEMLMNKEVAVRLKIESSLQYEDKNVIVGYKMNTAVPNVSVMPQPEITVDEIPF